MALWVPTVACFAKRSRCTERRRLFRRDDYGFGAFAAVLAAEVLVSDERHFDVEVEAIKTRAADALTVCWDHGRAAAAFAFKIAVEAARVGVQTRPNSSMNGRIEALSAFTQAESLVIHPASITQASLLNDIRAAISVSIAHFSVCTKHVEDICENIDQALKG
jgi:O-acetylhomoserine/O-acetylserine sulfhydrylase-like pyridoxal-dependent enzyme